MGPSNLQQSKKRGEKFKKKKTTNDKIADITPSYD